MADQPSDKILTRRQAVAALGIGVVAVGGAAAWTGTEATNSANTTAGQQIQNLESQLSEMSQKHELVQSQLGATQSKLDAASNQLDNAQNQIAALQQQLGVFKGLAGLYDTLETIRIDTIIAGALTGYKATLDALGGGIDVLRAGIVTAENALGSFENTFSAIRSALTDAEAAVANVGVLLKNVQDLLKTATSPLMPLLGQAQSFFSDLLSKIPFGIGDSAQQTINGIVGVVAAVPSTVDALENGLFRTLRERWFSDDNALTIQTTLSKPIMEGVLQPVGKFLDQVEATIKSWEGQVATPVHAALSQREIVQEQILEYKRKNGL